MKVFVAGHRGMVGAAICREIMGSAPTWQLVVRSRAELDLSSQAAVLDFMTTERPDYVIVAAAKVGGIYANATYPAQFIYENLVISTNLIHSAYLAGVQKLMFLGSSCVYPRDSAQPIREEYLLSGPLEKTNEPYAIAKLAGIKLCESYNRQYGTKYISVMPTNLYGPGDNYDLENSHVLPALLRKCHDAKIRGDKHLSIWGTGSARREFLHVQDLAKACLRIVQNTEFITPNHSEEDGGIHSSKPHQTTLINVGTGQDVTISELAKIIMKIVGFRGELTYDRLKPDGTPRKVLDVTKIKALNWAAEIDLEQGIELTYMDYLRQIGAR